MSAAATSIGDGLEALGYCIIIASSILAIALNTRR